MRDVWLTARYEVRNTLGRKAFWLTTFLLPVAVLLLVFLPQVFLTDSEGLGGGIPGAGSDTKTIGYVDPAGLLRTAPAGLPPGLVRSYDSETGAKVALAAAEIDRYYLISEDYLASGRLTVVETRYQPLGALDGRELITYVINTGIIGDEMVARLLLDPTPGSGSRPLAPTGSTIPDDPAAGYILPYLLMFVLYMALVMTSGFMLQSVSREKENRTAEVLLVSLKPRDMMLGKIAGLSAVGLLQVAIWLAVIFGVLFTQGSLAGIDLNIGGGYAAQVIPWTLVYFLLGYLLYASIYAMLGVLAPTARDANQYVILTIIPLVLPLLLLSMLSDAPNGALATTLSLFPLTSPIAMVARLGAIPVPWWQAPAGAVALAVFAYLFVLLAGRLFRADTLLSARALTWGRLKSELRPRAAGVAGAGVMRPEAGPSKQGWFRGAAAGARGAKEAPSRQRVYMLALIGIVMLVLGVSEYARGDSSGIIIAVAGVIVGVAAYLRYRKGR